MSSKMYKHGQKRRNQNAKLYRHSLDNRKTMINISTIAYDLDSWKNKLQFWDADMAKVPQNPFTFKKCPKTQDSEHLNIKLFKLLKTRSLVETDTWKRCSEQMEYFNHLLWDCRYSVNFWKEVEKQVTERYEINIITTS
jgi:hypothetical protein